MGRSPSQRRGLLAWIAFAACSLPAGRAHAEEAPRVRWVYEAPRECPSSAELEQTLRARVAATALESDPRTFVIQIAQTNGAFVGRLAFSDDAGERVVEERSCADVVEALVVFTAIALDPSRRPAETPEAPPAPDLPPHEPPPSSPSPPPVPLRESPMPPVRGRLPATMGFGAGAGVTSGPVPALAPVFTLGVGLHQPFSPEQGIALRLGVKATRGEKDVSTGRLDASLVAGQIEAAPTFTWRSLSFSGGPALTLGALSAVGQGISATRRTNAFWADVGVVLRGGVRTGGLRFEVYAAGGAALTPRSYLVQRPAGEREVHATPPLFVTIGSEIVIELGRHL